MVPVPVPCTSEGEKTGAEDTVPVPPAGSSPLCRLDEEGFCGFAGVGLVCAGAKETQTVEMSRVSRTTRGIESSLSSAVSRNSRARGTVEHMVREAGIEPARHR